MGFLNSVKYQFEVTLSLPMLEPFEKAIVCIQPIMMIIIIAIDLQCHVLFGVVP